MATVSRTCNVRYLKQGDKGDPATLYSVAPNPTQIKRDANGTPDASSFRIYSYKQIGDGVREEFPAGLMVQCVRYYTAANGAETSEHLIFKTPSATNIPTVTVSSADVRYEMFGVLPGATTAENRYTDHVTITILKDGQKGDTGATGGRGPALRGPMDWTENGPGFQYYSGAEGEPFIDFVVFQGNWYMCKKQHVSTSTNFPGSATANNFNLWQTAADASFVATTLLLAKYSLIENLGAVAITMKDASGNVVFEAKDGNVTCLTGTFENVVVSGLYHKKKTVVTAANFGNFFTVNQSYNDPDSGLYVYDINFDKCGTWLEFQYLPSNIVIYPKGHRDLCGNTILLYNKSSHSIAWSGNSAVKTGIGTSPSDFTSFVLLSNRFASIEFKIGSVNNKETAYFEVQTGTIDNTIS